MTKVNRALRRETAAMVRSGGRERPVIVVLRPPGVMIEFKLKGERRSYELPTQGLFELAVDRWVRDEKARKRAERKARRRSA